MAHIELQGSIFLNRYLGRVWFKFRSIFIFFYCCLYLLQSCTKNMVKTTIVHRLGLYSRLWFDMSPYSMLQSNWYDKISLFSPDFSRIYLPSLNTSGFKQMIFFYFEAAREEKLDLNSLYKYHYLLLQKCFIWWILRVQWNRNFL